MGILTVFKQTNINKGITDFRNMSGALLLDVRSPREYREGHIPGSENIPLLQLEELRGEPTVRISTSPLQNPVAQICKEHGFVPNVVVSCGDLQCLQRYIRAGTGIAITAPYSWPDMGDSRIRFVKVDARLSQQISIYWDSRIPRDPLWFQLTEQLQSYFNPTAPFWQAGIL